MSEYYLENDGVTQTFGAAVADALQVLRAEQGAVIYLQGDLGAGKTTLTRGLIRALGHDGAVKSPTYTLVEPYEFFDFPLYHFDLYRLSDPEEVEFLGVEEYFEPPAVCLIEWPCRGKGFLPAPDLQISLVTEGNGRRIRCEAVTATGNSIINRLQVLLHNAGIQDLSEQPS